MRLTQKRLETLTFTDLLELRENKVGENTIREYKRDYSAGTDADRKKIVQDISAFANTHGGVLAYGIDTERIGNRDTGVPSGFPGIDVPNFEALQSQVLSLVRDALDPALTSGIEIVEVPIPGIDRKVMLVGIERSPLQPHRVTHGGSSRFFRRNASGNYEPETGELKRMFLEADEWIAECERFRSERLGYREDAPQVGASRLVYVHLLPIGRMREVIDLRPHEYALRNAVTLERSAGNDARFNYAGFVINTLEFQTRNVMAYMQFFRSGGIESMSTFFGYDDNNGIALSASSLCDRIEKHIPKCIDLLGNVLDIHPPFCVLVSLLNFKGARIVDTDQAFPDGGRIGSSALKLQPVILEEGSNVRESLRSTFDTVYQAAGYAGWDPTA